MKKVLEIDSCYECPFLSVDAPEELEEDIPF